MMNRFDSLKIQRGFTIIELLVAMAIGLLMTAIIASLYIGLGRSFRYQESFSRLQENGRYAMSILGRDVRMAGFRGCGISSKFSNVLVGGDTNVYLNFNEPVIGYEGGVSVFPAEITAAGAVAGSDAFVLKGANSTTETLLSDHDPDAFIMTTGGHDFSEGDVLVVSDCARTTVFRMTSSADNTHIAHASSASPGQNCSGLIGGPCSKTQQYRFKSGATISRAYSSAYFVAPALDGIGRSLWRLGLAGSNNATPALFEIIDGVEGMQVEYGYDNDGDRAADQFFKANGVADWAKVTSIRLSVLLKSKRNNLTSTDQTESFNGTSVTDRRQQKVFTETIAIRNRTP